MWNPWAETLPSLSPWPPKSGAYPFFSTTHDRVEKEENKTDGGLIKTINYFDSFGHDKVHRGVWVFNKACAGRAAAGPTGRE